MHGLRLFNGGPEGEWLRLIPRGNARQGRASSMQDTAWRRDRAGRSQALAVPHDPRDSTPPGPPDPMPSTAAPAPAMPASSWPPPYLLYLGNARDHLAAKTARGLAYWRPQWCVGQFRGSDCKTTLGLPDLDFAQAVEDGANTMIVGVANAGGVMDDEAVQHVVAALDAGMNIASGLHQRLASYPAIVAAARRNGRFLFDARRSEEHTSELQSLMRI